MKQRLLVMNGQRIVQTEQGGKWITQKVGKAGALKPGIYNLYTAQPADKKQSHAGVIAHVDDKQVYQQVGKNFALHARSDFDKVPEIGSVRRIDYTARGKADVAAEDPKLTQRRSR